VAVIAAGTTHAPVIIERRRVALCDEALPRQPFHAVAEAGAPRAVIEAVRHEAATAATAALASLTIAAATAAPGAVVAAVAVLARPRHLPDDLDRVLASHALLHAAEGALYEQAVLDAAQRAAPVAATVHPRLTPSPEIDALGRRIGPPWQKDHKLAAMAALTLLATAGHPA
jgi:hypothetical protein